MDKPGRSNTLSLVTIDSSLVYPTTTRRFLMSLWEMQGLRIELLPRTIKEMFGFVQDGEKAYWHSALVKEERRTGQTWAPGARETIANSAAHAAGQWVNAELCYAEKPGRNDSMLTAVAMSDTQLEEAATIAQAIPRICFKGASKDNHRGDREIIAQASVCGFRVLATDNRSSIRRAQINGWLMETGLANDSLVLGADDAINHAGPWQDQPAHMLEAVLRACLPDQQAPAERENEIVTTFLGRMVRQGLENTADTCLDMWTGPSHRAIYDRARGYIAGEERLARATEARRLTRTRKAARDAGYGR